MQVSGSRSLGTSVEAILAHISAHRYFSQPLEPHTIQLSCTAWHTTASFHSMLVKEWSCVGIESVCGVSSLSSLMVVASRVSWESSPLQVVSAELFSCTLSCTVARLWKWPFSAKDSNLSESLGDAYSSSGCSVLCPSSFLGEPSTITRKDFHGIFLSCIYKSKHKTQVTTCISVNLPIDIDLLITSTSFKTIVSL
jgi:hypothetical protein